MKNTKKKKSKKKISKVVFNKVAKVASLATTVVAGEMIATKNAEANVTIGSTSGSTLKATGASLIGSGNIEGIAIGTSSKVNGAYGIALGKDSTSVQEGAIAIGKDSNALNKSAISLGYNSKASGGQSVAIGGNIQNDRGAQATGDQSISIGGDTVASGSSSIAIGGDDLDRANGTVGTLYSSLTGAPLVGTGTDRWIETKASGEASIAVGVQATSAGDLATAFGTKTKASGKFSTALGVGASSDGQGSIAVGGAASSVGATSIAIGTKVTTVGESASAIGYGSQANNKGSIAIGLNSKSGTVGSTEENTIAMGTNSQSLTANSVAIGTGSTGGSTGIGSSAVAIGNGASAKGSDGIALGSGSNANNMQNIAIGYKTETGKTQVAGSSNNTDIRNVSIGSEAGKGMGGKDNLFLGTSSGQTSNGDYNVAFGSGSGKSVTGSYNTAMGANAGIGVKNNNNVSIGADSGQNTDGLGNTAIGWQSGQAVKGNQNISMGYQSAKGLKGSSNTVIGNQAGIGGVEGDNNIIVGTNATRLYTTGGSLKVQNVVSLGTNSKAYTDNSMSIGSYSEATGKAAIAIGQGSKASKDNSMAIGNGTLANTANGDVALGSGSATKAVTAVSNVTITPPSSKSITYGTFAGNNPQSAVSVGAAGNERQIQNVAAGRVTKDSTDAINGSQLFAVANELGKTWKGNAGKTGSGDLIGSATSTQVMPGDEVQFIAGDNLSIKQETSTGTQKYTYSLKKDVDLGPNGSLKAGPVTINNNGINAGNKTITNVSPGVNPTDAANVSQVKAAKTEVKSTDNTVTVTSSTDPTKGNTIYDLSVDAANKNLSNINNAGKGVISDIATKSINVAAGTNVKDVTSNTVTNADGTKTTTFTVNAKGANVVAGDGVTVTSSAGANNVTDYTVAVKDTTLTTNGTTVTAGNNNNFAKAGDVANAITNAANAAKTEVKSPDSSINVTADNTSPDGHTIYNITVDKTGKVAAGDTKLVTGDTVNTAINKAVSNPLTFAGDNAGGDVTRKLGEKLNIKGGATGATAANNIKVTADGTDTLNIELAKDLTGLDSITTNGGNTTINNSGITTPTVTADKVTINNAPTAGTDATNKTYVDSTKTEVTSNDNSVVVSKSTKGNKDVYDLSVDITKLDAANKDLSNITNAGKGVINNIARNSVDVVAGTNIAGVTTSTSTNTDGTTKTTFTVDAKGASVVAGDGVTVTSAAGTNNVTDYTVAVKNTSLTTTGTTVTTTDPNSYVKAGDLATAITNVGKAAKTEVKSSDNSIGVTSSAGTDGNTIYDLKVDTSGTVTPGNNKLVTGDTVNTAINNAKTDLINNNPLTFAGDSGTDVTRKLGEKLNVKGGATGATTTGNIAVKADGTDTLNIELAKDLTGLDSITTNGGNTTINNSGITTPTVTADKVTINNAPTAGTDATNKTYVDSTKTEVTSNDNSVVVSKSTKGNKDVYDLSVDITKLDAANKDLSNITNAGKGVINNIARNSVDVVAGTNIAGVTTSTSTNTDGTTKTTFTVDAKGANVVAGDGVTVTSAAGANNVTDYTVAVKNTSLTTSGTTVSTTDPNSYVKAGDLATAITNVGKAAKTEVKSSDNSIGVTSSAGTDGNTIYDLKVDTSGTVTPGNNKLVTGDTVNTAINNAKTDLINNNPLTFAGDSGTDVTRKLGEKLNVKGGATGATTTGNIAVKADGTDTLNIELAKDLTGLDSITTNGGTKIDNNGITINNGAGSPVTLGPTGLNNGGNPITGVGAGTNKTDAVNVGQLDDKIANSKWQLTTSKSTGTVSGTTVEDINPNEVVTIDAGKNIGITQSGNKITIDTDFTSVANAIGGGTTVDPTTGAINTTGANIGGTGKTNVSDAVAAAKTTVTSKNGSVTVSPTTDPDGHTNYDLKVDTNSIAAGTNLTYKANGTNDQTTTLANGLDFNNGKNTVASVDANGKVVYDIKDNIDLGTAGSVTAGNTTINNGGVTTPTLTLTNSTPINSSTGGKATVPTGNGNQAVTAQTVADAINALGNNTINLKAADGTVTGKQNLNKDGGLEFEITGSNGISTTATGNKVDVTIAQSGLTTTTSPTGAAVVTPTTGGNTYATAGDVANAIQNAVNSSGWNVVADKTGTGTTSGTVANELIKPGDTVKLQAGNNLNVDQTGGTFTYSLKDDISLNSVTTGDTKISNGGVTITNPAGSNVTLGPTGLNNGGNTITNVAPGVNNNDAANYGQVKAAKTEVQAGKNVTVTSTTGANDQTIYTVNTDFTSVANAIGGGTTVDPTTGAINTTGANIGGTGKTNVSDAVAAAKTTVTSADKSVTVVETTGTDGHSNYDLKVDTASIAKNTNLTYKANGANNQTTTLSDGLDFQDGKNTVASVDANGKVVYDIKDNIDLGTAGSVTAGNTTINNGGVTTPTLTLTNSTPINSSTGGKATVPTGNGNQAVTAQTVADAINALGNNTINLKAADGTVTGKQNLNKDGGLEFEITGSNGISTTATGNKVDVTIAQSGLTTTTSPTGAAVVTPTTGGNTYATAGDVANAIQNAVNSSGWNVVADKTGTGTTSGTVANELIKPGDTVKLQAGNNLNVDQTGGTFTYSLKDDISLNSVTTGDTKISNGGVTITNPAGSPVTLGPSGLNNGGNTITNVGAGKNGTDAVNLDQLTKATGASKTEVANGTNTNVTSSTGTNGQTIYKVNADKSEVATTGTGLTLTPTTTTDTDGTKTTTYTLGLDTTTLTTGANGSVTAPSTADAGKVVTAGSVADAINKSGFTLKSSANGGTLGSSTGDEVINPGDVIDMAAGKNLKVEQAANGKITYSLLDDVDLGAAGSIKAGDTTLNNGGITINNGAAGSPVTLGPSGLNNGGNTITNVGAGKNGTDAVNLDQLTKATGASKTEVANGTNTNVTSSTGTNGQTIYKVNADKSEVATTGTGLTLTPTTTTDTDGTKTTTYTLGLDTTTLTTGANGSVTAPSTADAGKVVTAGSVADAINKSGFTLKSSANGGTLGSSTGDEVINPGDVIDMAAGKNLKVEQAANGKITYSLLDDININSVTAGNNKFDKTGLTISDGAGNTTVTTPSGTTYTSSTGDTTKVGPNGITINNGAAGNPVSLTKNGLDNGGNTITNVAPGVNGTDAVNVTQLKNTVNNAVNNGPVVYTNAAGDKVVKANDGNYYKASDVDANGNPLPGAVAVNPTDINHSLLNADGTTTNPSKLTNIADGLISPTSKDAINGSQLYKNATSVSNIIGGNSVVNPDGTLTTSNIGNTGKNTVHDAIGYLNQGFNVTTSASNGTVSGTSVEAVKAGETVTIDAGKNIAVTQNGKTISIATKDDLSVSSVTATDPAGNTTVLNPTGTTITDVAGNSNVSTATSNKLTDAAGNSNVATAAGNTYTSATGDITNVGSNGITITSGGTTVSLTNAGLNNGGNKITNVAAGVAPTDAVNVSQLDTAVNNLNTTIGAAKTEVVAGTNTTVTSTQGANKQTIYKIDADGTTVSGGSSFVSVTPGTKDANNITDYKVDLSQSTKDTLNSIGTGNIAAGDNNTVTGSTVHNYLQNNPLTYTDDNGTTLTRNLGQNLNVVGRATGPLTTGNIGVAASGTDTLEVKLAENVNLGPNGSVTMGNTVVNNDGVTINGGPSITSNGIDGGGKKLTNVAEGDITPTSRDVVTGGQVYNAVIAGTADKATRAELVGVNDNLTAGIAGVAAMANLPQINDAAANRFNVAVAGGAYKNGRAMALGFSGISDGGRFIYKASASLNNKNDVTVGLGMGYQFGKRDVEPNELDRLKSMVTLLEQQKDSYSRQLKKQLEEEASKNRENSELIKQLMQEVQELKNRR